MRKIFIICFVLFISCNSKDGSLFINFDESFRDSKVYLDGKYLFDVGDTNNAKYFINDKDETGDYWISARNHTKHILQLKKHNKIVFAMLFDMRSEEYVDVMASKKKFEERHTCGHIKWIYSLEP